MRLRSAARLWHTGAASKEVGLGGLEDHAAKSRNLCSVRLFLCLDSVLWRPRQESRKARRLSAPRGHLSANPAVGCHHILADAGNPRLTKLGAVAMTATALVPVEFHGATLYAITVDGVHHVALRPICDALGIDWEAQRLRIRRHPVLNETACVTKAVAADGKEREVVALPLDKLNGWLFGVSVNRVKPELREKLISYQRECFEVLARHFMPAQRPHNPAIDYDRISPAQAQDLKELVHAVVDAKVQGFAETWARLHKRFRVNSYLELPATRFEEARDYLLGKLPEQDRAGTVNELVAEWVRKIEAPNGYPASLFQPLVDAVQRKLGHQLPPGKMVVDRQKLAAVWSDLGKLRNRIDGLGILESDLPPSWWRQQQISG